MHEWKCPLAKARRISRLKGEDATRRGQIALPMQKTLRVSATLGYERERRQRCGGIGATVLLSAHSGEL